MLIVTLIDLLAILSTIVLVRILFKTARSGTPLPPGPKGYPIIGNFFDIPKSHEWMTFAQWGKLYGDLLSLSVFGNTMVVINSYSKAVEMFDKKGAIYSDRPPMIMAGELMDWKRATFLSNGPYWKASRALLWQEVGANISSRRHEVVQQERVHKFLQQLAKNPQKLEENIAQYTGAVLLATTYGYRVDRDDDPLVVLAKEAMDVFLASTNPGTYLVNHLPVLKCIPSWVPGTGFQKFAAHGRKLAHRLADEPYRYVKRQMAQGNAPDSFTSRLISEGGPEELTKWTAMGLLGAGSETTTASIYSFFHLMVLNHDIQKRAQNEIDTVLGPNALPSFSDKESLPYINALLKEVLRFHPVGPLGVPHYTTDRDIQNGYLIPKKSVVLANLWGMCHDPEVYKDPMAFNPSRFLGDNPERDPRDIVFGFGRRICPGAHLAQASLYLVCTSTLALFDITPVVDDAGKPDLPKYEYTAGGTSYPVHFRCTIKLRSSKDLSLLLDL